MVNVTVVVWVEPPPVPVTVIVRVPVVAFGATRICIEACPEPGAAMVLGLKRTFTPAPCPDADKAIAELKPPDTVVVICETPAPPRATLTVFGDAATVKVPVFPVTERETVVVCVVLPAVPVTVMV